MKRIIKRYRNPIIFTHDALMAGISLPLALYLRLGENMFAYAEDYLLAATVLSAVVYALYSITTRLYRQVWRYVSLRDLVAITQACVMSVLVIYLTLFLTMRLEQVPRSLPLIQLLTMIAAICGTRLAWRLWHDRTKPNQHSESARKRIPVVLIRAGNEAELFIREAKRNPEFAYEVLAVIDDRAELIGRDIHHVRVHGDYSKLPEVIAKCERKKGQRPQRLILTDVQIPGDTVREILTASEEANIPLARLPRLTDFSRGAVDKLDIRPIDVEDILGRPQSNLDRPAMRKLTAGKRVLVTGAGGSIGGELVRQISNSDPASLVLLDNNEFALYQIDAELHSHATTHPRHVVLEDIRHAEGLARAFEHYKPEIVFHAAALKHVPMMEAHPHQAVLTNVQGTRNVADACCAHNVELMVQVSTDKAVNPTSVMGTTKKIGETYTQALAATCETRFVTVRFGNVLGSNGSVVPLFQRQLEKGGPITITHPDMTRYFMTIKEAVQLILQAAALPPREQGKASIYVLDMGEPVRIKDLAEQMIRLAGLTPHEDIALEYIGLRPGEKLYEELFHDAESLEPTAHEAIRSAAAREVDLPELLAQLEKLIGCAEAVDKAAIREALLAIVPEYRYEAADYLQIYNQQEAS